MVDGQFADSANNTDICSCFTHCARSVLEAKLEQSRNQGLD